MNKIIYKLNISGKQAIEHAFKYGIYSERLESRKDAVSRINNFMGYCSRNGLTGVFKTELCTAINSNDEVVFFATLYKITETL